MCALSTPRGFFDLSLQNELTFESIYSRSFGLKSRDNRGSTAVCPPGGRQLSCPPKVGDPTGAEAKGWVLMTPDAPVACVLRGSLAGLGLVCLLTGGQLTHVVLRRGMF